MPPLGWVHSVHLQYLDMSDYSYLLAMFILLDTGRKDSPSVGQQTSWDLPHLAVSITPLTPTSQLECAPFTLPSPCSTWWGARAPHMQTFVRPALPLGCRVAVMNAFRQSPSPALEDLLNSWIHHHAAPLENRCRATPSLFSFSVVDVWYYRLCNYSVAGGRWFIKPVS